MRREPIMLLLACVLSAAAFALDDVVTVRLEPMSDSGQAGTATLMPEGDKTKVVILLSNSPPGVVQPAHIHLGHCDKLDKAPKWHLEAVKDGRSLTVVPVPLETILQESAAVNIHKSAAEPQIYVSCGNIVAAM